MSEERESIGRIEVAPEVIAMIAYFATLRVDGVVKTASIPSDVARAYRRTTRKEGIILDLSEDKVRFNIYVIMDSQVNIMETSRKLQTAVAETINTLVGINVDTVNVHVDDVEYEKGQAV